MAGAWIAHVKSVWKKKGGSYKDAMKAAAKTWKGKSKAAGKKKKKKVSKMTKMKKRKKKRKEELFDKQLHLTSLYILGALNSKHLSTNQLTTIVTGLKKIPTQILTMRTTNCIRTWVVN